MAGIGIGIDGGAGTSKLVAGRDKGGQFQLLHVAVHQRKLGKSDGAASDEIADAIQEAIDDSAAKKAPAVVGLTGRDLMIRYSQAPNLPIHRLKVLMDFEVNEISEKIEGEVSADYNLLPGEIGDGGEQMAIIAMAKDSYLEGPVDAVLDRGYPVRYTTPNMIAIYNAFLRCGSFQEGETTLHLDIGHENADLAIQRDGDLLFARNLNFGGKSFTDALAANFSIDHAKAEELKRTKGQLPTRGETSFADGLTEKSARVLTGVLGQLVGLVQSSISFCKVQWKRQDLKVDRVILSGGGALLPGLPRALSENLGVTVEVFDPTDRVDLSQLDPEEAKLVTDRPQLFAVPIGLALMAADSRYFAVQILPTRLRKKKAIRERTSFLVAAGVLAIAYLVISASLGKKSLAAAEKRHESLSSQEAKRRRNESKYEEALAENQARLERLELVHRQLAPGFALAKTVEAVQGKMGDFDGLWIQTIELKERKQTKTSAPPPLVVVRGSGIETDEDVSRVANRFAGVLKTTLAEGYGARTTSTYNRRQSTFEIEIDFYPEPVAGEGDENEEE